MIHFSRKMSKYLRPPTVIVQKHKHTVILDLDDTLIQTYFYASKDISFSPYVSDYQITVCKGGTLSLISKNGFGIVCIRPGAVQFWLSMQTKYNVGIWSAGERNYVHLMVNIFQWYTKHIMKQMIERPMFIWDKRHLSSQGIKELSLLPKCIQKSSVLLDDNELHRGYNGKRFIKCKPYTLYPDKFMFGKAQTLVDQAIKLLA